MTSLLPYCEYCEIYLFDNNCLAFLDGIPEEILNGKIDHRKPYNNDNGFQFKPKDKEASQYIEEILNK